MVLNNNIPLSDAINQNRLYLVWYPKDTRSKKDKLLKSVERNKDLFLRFFIPCQTIDGNLK